jgi:CDP-glycerol glycerophosphotransferase
VTRSRQAAGAPLISVVLAVRGVAAYLPGCLDSILGQPDVPAGIEVIAVDDASPDGCGAILDTRATADPRLRVIHLAEQAGPGPARMRGLAESAGAFVWFADPDDLLAEGSLAAVADRLERDRPDVLLVDYRILRAAGGSEPSPGASLAGAPGVLTLAGRPALLTRTMTLWSKVFRRAFLTGLGVPISPGIHEDVPVSATALLMARRIALLDRVCYLYRRRPGSFLATASMGHFDIFASYARVFAAVAGAPAGPAADAEVRAALFGRMLEHYSSILASGLVPRSARRRFFGRMAADFRRYRPPGYRRPPGLHGLKTALIRRDAYRAYAVLAPVNNARVMARRMLAGAGLTSVTPAATGPASPGPAAVPDDLPGHMTENHEQVT